MPSLTRRSFIQMSLSATVAVALPWSVQAEELDSRVQKIVSASLGIDIHNHIDVPMIAAEVPGPNLDLKGELLRSGLGAICATFATDYQPGDSYQRFLAAMDSLDRQLESNKLKRSLTQKDVQENRTATVIQSVEGAHFLEGKLDRVEEAYQRGLRHFGLLHDSDANVPLGDVYTNPPKFGGLTAFGKAVVKECNRLGILIDLAHADKQTTALALKTSTRPVVISHTGLDTQLGTNPRMAQMMRPRLIGKDQARSVAAAGGAIGVWTHLADTPLAYAQNLRALVEIIGVDHVCLGTDTKLTPSRGRQPQRPGERTNAVWATQTVGYYYAVVDAMLKTGFSPEEIAKIGGGNYLRIFGEAVG